jgi:hypothetical protein
MLRWMITGKFITHNPIYLFMMFVFGLVVGIVPLAMLVVEVFLSGDFRIVFYVTPVIFPYMFTGMVLVINVGISVFNPRAKSITGD